MKRDVYKLLAEKYDQINNPVSSENPETVESFRQGEQALEAKNLLWVNMQVLNPKLMVKS